MVFYAGVDDAALCLDDAAAWRDIGPFLNGKGLDLVEDLSDLGLIGFEGVLVGFIDVDGKAVVLGNGG